jgi:hypothetical protein
MSMLRHRDSHIESAAPVCSQLADADVVVFGAVLER